MKFKKEVIIILMIGIVLCGGFYLGSKAYKNYQEQNQEAIVLKDATLDTIDQEADKVNIYVFWGDGCPHCEELFEFLDNNKKKYGKYFNAYGFEVWYNDENGKLLDQIKEELGEETGSRGVPYFIIGDKAMSGFDGSMKKEIEDLILSKYKTRKDIKKFKSLENGVDLKKK
ncbi:MAG: thioredoxin family protein [Bacilli bacterium]|nr:thioredoxin family protein [Bacilli bacterium]